MVARAEIGRSNPEGLRVVVEIGGEAGEKVLEDEDAEEIGVAELDGDVPGQRDWARKRAMPGSQRVR